MDLKNSCCLITGSTGTLGRIIALALAEAGADCICHYHSRADLAGELAGQIVRLGRKAMLLAADLTQPQEIDALFEKAAGFGPIRILVNSAAIFIRRPLMEVSLQTIRQTLDMNLIAPLLLSRAFVKRLSSHHQVEKNGQVYAKIVNLTDVGGIRPWAEYSEYCASKAGLIGMTKSLAKELAPRITVNAIAPGIVTWPQPLDTPSGNTNCSDNKKMTHIPMGRFGKPEEIAQAVLFLLNNDYITGQIINIDGGKAI